MAELVIHQIPVLSDNYVYLVHDPDTGSTGVIDPAVSEPVLKALKEKGWRLTHILNTHHHADHVGGNMELKQATGCHVVGPRADRARIPGIETEVGDGDTYMFGAQRATVFDIPGHTRGHIAYWFPESRAAFVGDTIFMLGCGRLFEGTPQTMWSSLSKLKKLPPDTRIYCAHEYTQSNARFALTVEPSNDALQRRAKAIDAARAAGKPTVPATLSEELATNPFLRADRPELQRDAGLEGRDPASVFGEIRQRKDNFR
jgi:hydroxyacylglutathione hydrolase